MTNTASFSTQAKFCIKQEKFEVLQHKHFFSGDIASKKSGFLVKSFERCDRGSEKSTSPFNIVSFTSEIFYWYFQTFLMIHLIRYFYLVKKKYLLLGHEEFFQIEWSVSSVEAIWRDVC
ncbi:hypothetical protein HELRODRAFT_166044 [Helobdella robusta]|uniref:Uncharacterized protein n=1 Tax=Helobdella robusta TaxID=6412 RepID=T1EXM8_HELRO|nr:hypothetical protein HELRODRAFT_166044 [Helobdella robusta]ESN90382.1 hypothetical protein HELRODRAFT_166044 [Helobdella robusta]